MAKESIVRAALESGMRFDITTGSGYHVAVDAAKDIGGQNSAPSPMEMLLVGLAGCMGITVLSILKKQRAGIRAYDIQVHGTKAEEHPKVYTSITVEHIFTGSGINQDAVKRAIDLSEEHYCGASAMLGKTAKVTHTFRIIDE